MASGLLKNFVLMDLFRNHNVSFKSLFIFTGSNDKTILMWDVKGRLSLDTDLAPSLSAFRDKLSGSSFDSTCGPVRF